VSCVTIWQCGAVRQCVAVCAAVRGSARGSVRQYEAVRLRQYVAVRMVVCTLAVSGS
jgi:hypothetical protein